MILVMWSLLARLKVVRRSWRHREGGSVVDLEMRSEVNKN